MENESELVKLAKAKFGDLTERDVQFFAALGAGKAVGFASNDPADPDPSKSDCWPEYRTIKAEYVSWLVTDVQAAQCILKSGIQIRGAKISGELDLSDTVVLKHIQLVKCSIPDGIGLFRAQLKSFILDGSHVGPIVAHQSHFTGDLMLIESTQVHGELGLRDSIIEGNMILNGSKFANEGDIAICADGLVVKRSIFLSEGFEAIGAVRLLNARIEGALFSMKSSFSNPEGDALNAEGIRIDRNLLIGDGFKSEGEVNILGANIGGRIEAVNCTFSNIDGIALQADSLVVNGSVFFRSEFYGMVRICSASIQEGFDCEGATFSNPGNDALLAIGIRIGGNVSLSSVSEARDGFEKDDPFRADGRIVLVDARIMGTLSFRGALLKNPGGEALAADRVRVEGNINLDDGFSAEGEVRLLSASCGCDFDCSGSEISNAKGIALNADGISIGGAALLKSLIVNGETNFLGSIIRGNLECDGAIFLNPGKAAFRAPALSVKGSVFFRSNFYIDGSVDFSSISVSQFFTWKEMHDSTKFTLDLRHAEVRTLSDDSRSWPIKDRLYLKGFRYKDFELKSPSDAVSRLAWLRLQPKDQFNLQSYDVLALTLANMGHEVDLKQVRIQKNSDLRRLGNLPRLRKFWNLLLGLTISHGYSPSKTFWPISFLIVVGAALFHLGNTNELFSPTKVAPYQSNQSNHLDIADDYPTFSPLMYSIDSFIPIVDFHQEEFWIPNNNSGSFEVRSFTYFWGGLLRMYLWFHIAAGWLLTSIFLLALTGLIKP